MIKVVSVEMIRQIEAAVDASGYSYAAMMEDAGKAAAKHALSKMSGETRVTVLVGPGNNGGDGLVAGRIIAQENPRALVRFYLLKKRPEEDPNLKVIRSLGLFVADSENDMRFRVLHNLIASAHIVIDAIFGIGLHLPVEGEITKFLRAVNQALNENEEQPSPTRVIDTTQGLETTGAQESRKPYVLALDCPTGLDALSGHLDKHSIPATDTITFIAAKPGLLTFPGASAVGRLFVAPLAVNPNLETLDSASTVLADLDYARSLLPARPEDGNKGTFGKLLIIGGSLNYIGAPGLSAQAANAIGTGFVTIGAPQPVITPLAAQMLDVTWIPLAHDMGALAVGASALASKTLHAYSALLLGPGIGRENTTRELLIEILTPAALIQKRARSMGFLSANPVTESVLPQSELPALVLDADALNLLSTIDGWWKLLPSESVITPHPGEMARLVGTDVSDIQENRWKWAQVKAAEWNTTVVLKGAHTVVAVPSGKLVVMPFKTPALAKAGTGDVLAGIIAGLLAQKVSAFDAATLGAFIHGLAGQIAAQMQGHTRSLSPMSLVHTLPLALARIERN